jgi:hypothetical protein
MTDLAAEEAVQFEATTEAELEQRIAIWWR